MCLPGGAREAKIVCLGKGRRRHGRFRRQRVRGRHWREVISKKAFTLVELLVVVSIIAVLVILFLPNLNSIKGIARASICRNNLHDLQIACTAYEGKEVREGRVASRYPSADWWPNPAPMLAVTNPSLYICPEDNATSGNSTVAGSGGGNGPTATGSGESTNGPPPSFQSMLSQLHMHMTGIGTGTLPYDVPFDSSNYYCHTKDFPDRIEYWFEDYGSRADNWTDAGFYITKAPPISLNWMQGTFTGNCNQLLMGDTILIPDCRYPPIQALPGDKGSVTNTNNSTANGAGTGGVATSWAFTFQSLTNYGMNVNVGGANVKGGTVVLLDYLYPKAHGTEDMTATLKDVRSARHRGKINVLLSDGAALLMTPSQLDPAYPGTADLWSAQ
jgi:prepilin-type N-terminal cleavage/methylation domain-containing protein